MHFSARNAFIWLFICLFVLNLSAVAATPADYSTSMPELLEAGHLYGDSCLVMDASSGRILFEKNAYERRYPASTTKIMTCILAIEYGPVGQRVTIPNGITVSNDSSKLGIVPGEVMLFDDLLYGMMLASGNDAALAIAILVSGSEAKFVELMNKTAASLGMNSTHYENSHGYHSANHCTTAYDLAILTQYAMKEPMFRDIVACVDYVIDPTNAHPEGLSLTTKYDLLISNKPLYYEYCIGVKTGSTKNAGRCFVGAAKKDDTTLISVTLNTDSDDKQYVEAFTDTIRLFKYGFSRYQALSFYEIYEMCEDQYLSVAVDNAAYSDPNNGYLKLSIVDMPQTYREWFLVDDLEDLYYQKQLVEDFTNRISVVLDENALVAPIKAGDVLGSAQFKTPAGEIYTGYVAASRDVEEEPPTIDEVMDEWIENNAPFLFKLMPRHNPPVRILYWALFAVIIVLIVMRVRKVRRRNRLRRQQLERKRREYIKRQKQREAYLKAHPEMRNAKSAAARVPSAKTPAKRPPVQGGASQGQMRPVKRTPSSVAGVQNRRPAVQSQKKQ